MKNLYEEYFNQLKENNTIWTFDVYYQFSPLLMSEKQNINEEIANNDNKAINQEEAYIESNNGREPNTTQDDSEQK